jgi:hypothetical protein
LPAYGTLTTLTTLALLLLLLLKKKGVARRTCSYAATNPWKEGL